MLKWVALIVVVIAGSILGYFYVELKKLEHAPVTIPTSVQSNAIRVNHSFSDGFHRYSGYIRLPHSCYSLKTQVDHEQLPVDAIFISLTTTDNIVQQKYCSKVPTRYQFESLTDAPVTTQLKLFVNGVARETIITEVAWKSPLSGTVRGNFVDTGVSSL